VISRIRPVSLIRMRREPPVRMAGADLNANTAVCTLVYFHHPVYNVGPEGDTSRLNDIWSCWLNTASTLC
jgi:hypothetical protein